VEIKTNVIDRFKAWEADPDTPKNPTLHEAFVEGFTQAMEWISGGVRTQTENGDAQWYIGGRDEQN
jgi:hypothetical protein